MANTPSIQVNNLSYQFQDGSSGLADVSLYLPAGSRILLIGGKHEVRPAIDYDGF